MPVPKEPEKMDAVLDGMLTLLDVMNRQIVAMGNICIALKSDGPATFTLPDPPAHLLKTQQPPDPDT